MAKGAEAKSIVENKIRDAFGKDFIGIDTSSKKIYVQANEGGEMIQVAITMTCPKTPFVAGGSEPSAFGNGNFAQPDVFQPVEITSEELDNVRKLIKEFDL